MASYTLLFQYKNVSKVTIDIKTILTKNLVYK